MSYVTMDHAAWLEGEIAATKKMNAGRKRRSDRGLENGPEKLSEFQAKVFDILGMVGGGIYNAPISWATVEWKYGPGVSLLWNGPGLDTFDFNQLTRLVFLCHEARIRLSVSPGGHRHLRLAFFPREAEGSFAVRHPSLDEAVTQFRDYLPARHRIVYGNAAAPASFESEPA